jgi:hypothetical protein
MTTLDTVRLAANILRIALLRKQLDRFERSKFLRNGLKFNREIAVRKLKGTRAAHVPTVPAFAPAENIAVGEQIGGLSSRRAAVSLSVTVFRASSILRLLKPMAGI